MSGTKKKDKRANGDGTIRQRTVIRNGKKYVFWEGTITVGIHPGSGKPLRKTFTGKSQKEVAARMRDAGSAVDKGEYFVVSVFKQQYREQTEKRLAAGECWKGWQSNDERKTGLVFSSDLGEHLGVATIWREYKKLVDQAGAPSARIHDLRHTFAVNALQNGDDYKTVQDNLGHATAAFTLDVYGHVSERMKEESAKRQQAFIESLRA